MTDYAAHETKGPPASARLLGPLALMEGENPQSYQELLDQMSNTLKPADIFEEIWTREVAELTWDAFRLRRMKANGLREASMRALESALEPLFGEGEEAYDTMRETARKLAEGNPAAVESVAATLAASGLSIESAVARNVSPHTFEVERADRIDRMIARLEARRKSVLHEFERHREKFAPKLRRASGREASE
jgi:hypothetical protein